MGGRVGGSTGEDGDLGDGWGCECQAEDLAAGCTFGSIMCAEEGEYAEYKGDG